MLKLAFYALSQRSIKIFRVYDGSCYTILGKLNENIHENN